ncbi:MAG: hypothetical protein LBU11_08765, partial [Zoogloeaceae bacterium]|nr:hypothetical protein [Zoogloeaceae bacterium]
RAKLAASTKAQDRYLLSFLALPSPFFGRGNVPGALLRPLRALLRQSVLFGRQDGARGQDAQAQQVGEMTRAGLAATV